jgi:hypothetical protein
MALRGLARSWRCALQGAAAHTQQCAATAAASCSARRAASGAPASPSAPETSSGGASPSVFDRVVQIFVIDKAGVRHTVRGLVGQTLAAALSEYPAQFPSDSFMPHPYDPAYPDCHCYIQGVGGWVGGRVRCATSGPPPSPWLAAPVLALVLPC